jgi:hypothetical protein
MLGVDHQIYVNGWPKLLRRKVPRTTRSMDATSNHPIPLPLRIENVCWPPIPLSMGVDQAITNRECWVLTKNHEFTGAVLHPIENKVDHTIPLRMCVGCWPLNYTENRCWPAPKKPSNILYPILWMAAYHRIPLTMCVEDHPQIHWEFWVLVLGANHIAMLRMGVIDHWPLNSSEHGCWPPNYTCYYTLMSIDQPIPTLVRWMPTISQSHR